MGHVYRERHEIPKPGFAHINKNDGRVFIIKKDGTGKRNHKTIGYATSDTMMHPNDNYRFLFPNLWEQNYGDSAEQKHMLHAGLYAAALGIGYQTDLYPILHKVYGPLYGNAIMDYALYSILDRSDSTLLFPDQMADQVLFSGKPYSDSWYSKLFKVFMTPELNHKFRIEWLKHCAASGDTKVWLSIDGSNNDCAVQDSELAEHGKAKSRKSSKIVSYIWAVSVKTGMPITYFVNRGSVADTKAFHKVEAFLNGSGIEIEGIILDRGFCNFDVLKALKDAGRKYIIMLKSDTHGHTEMMKEYSETIRWRVPYIIDGEGIFGISDEKQVFSLHPDKAFINLYFDASNGTERSLTLIRKIWAAEKEARERIRQGKEASIPSELSNYLSVKTEGDTQIIVRNETAFQEDIDKKGYASIASSEDCGPEETNRLYHLRDVSEKQFMIMKSQMGYDTTRVHSDASIESRFAVCFVAAIMRSIIMNKCRELRFDTNRIIRELDNISFLMMVGGEYETIRDHTDRQKKILGAFGIRESDFDVFVQDVNTRMNSAINSQVHRLPDDPNRYHRKKPGPKPKAKKQEAEPAEKRRPGRPKGSKNKKTLEKEKALAVAQGDEKRGRGRPKGSKNKKVDVVEKRRPGRPKGSKNKPKPSS